MIIHNRREIDPDGQTPKSKPSPAVWIAPVAALSAVLVCIGIVRTGVGALTPVHLLQAQAGDRGAL